MKKTRKTRKARTRKKKPGIIQRCKRFTLILSGGLFISAAGIMYAHTHSIFDSHAGRAATWAAGRAAAPIAEGVSWQIWAISIPVLVFLTWKHKLVMALILGALVGIIGGIVL